MEDDPSGFDYLGRPQPLAPQRINVAGGGGGISAPATPSVGTRAQAAQILLSGGGGGGGGQSDFSKAIGAASTAKSALDVGRSIKEMFPAKEQTTRGTEFSSAGPDISQIDPSRDFLGSAAGPTSFGDVDLSLMTQIQHPAVQVGGNLVGSAADTLSSEGVPLTEGAAGAAGSAFQVIPALGAAYALAQDITSNNSDARKAANATLIAASVFSMGAFKAIDEISGAVGGPQLGDLFEAVFGKPGLSHEQRENLEVGKHIAPEAQAMQQSLNGVKTLDDLYARLTSYGSGYTGGTSKRALSVSLPMDAEALNAAVQAGDVTLPKGMTVDQLMARSGQDGKVQVDAGNPNAYYPVFTKDGFFKHLAQNPGSLQTGVQAGVDQGKLKGLNTALGETILQKYAELRPQPVMPQMPVNAPAQVTPAGPAGSLDFAQSLLQDPTAGP